MNNISSLLNGLSLTKIIGGLNKTLNFVNQAIPLYQQLKPIISNSKDLLNILNDINNEKDTPIKELPLKTKKVSNNNLPTFFQ